MVCIHCHLWYAIIVTYGMQSSSPMVCIHHHLWYTIIVTYGMQSLSPMVCNYCQLWYAIIITYVCNPCHLLSDYIVASRSIFISSRFSCWWNGAILYLMCSSTWRKRIKQDLEEVYQLAWVTNVCSTKLLIPSWASCLCHSELISSVMWLCWLLFWWQFRESHRRHEIPVSVDRWVPLP